MIKKIAIITSSQDSASVTIYNSFLDSGDFEPTEDKSILKHKKISDVLLYHIDELHVLADDLDKKIDADLFVFGSRHRSKENTKAFTVHSIGNWGEADTGKTGKLCPSSALLQKEIYLALQENNREEYEVSMEATHHGPYVQKPALFVEIGSTEEQWQDKDNGEVIATSIMQGINQYLENNNEGKTAIGIGGPHYPINFQKLTNRKGIGFSHICPKHHLNLLNKELLQQAIDANVEKVSVILDWKGLGQEKQRIVALLQEMTIEFERTDQLLKK